MLVKLKWNILHFFFGNRMRKLCLNLIVVLKNIHLKGGRFERTFKYSWKSLERTVFEDSAAVLRLTCSYCWCCFAMVKYLACSGNGHWRDYFWLLGSVLQIQAQWCEISLNVWHFTNSKRVKLMFCFVFFLS